MNSDLDYFIIFICACRSMITSRVNCAGLIGLFVDCNVMFILKRVVEIGHEPRTSIKMKAFTRMKM